MVDERSEVESWDVGDGGQGDELHDDSQNLRHGGEDEHDVEFDSDRNGKLHEANKECWVNVCKILSVINAIFHHH